MILSMQTNEEEMEEENENYHVPNSKYTVCNVRQSLTESALYV